MTHNDEEGARAAAHYFYELHEYAAMAPDPEAIRGVLHETCYGCEYLTEAAERHAAADVRQGFEATALVGIESVTEQPGTDKWTVRTVLAHRPIFTVDIEDSVVEYLKQDLMSHEILTLSFDDGQWLVRGIQRVT